MARRYKRKTRIESQREYRARRALYEKYKESTLSTKTFKEWNEPYRKQQFLKKEFKLYKKMFETRKESARFGFRLTEEGKEVEAYNFRDFKNRYEVTRNDLEAEVEMGERSRIGSVITEMINDQAYELSRPKAQAIAKYLLKEERPLLMEKGILRVETDEMGKSIDVIKNRNLALLIRQGRFVDEEVGLWDEIKEVYKWMTKEQGMSALDARNQIGLTYFESDPEKQKKRRNKNR